MVDKLFLSNGYPYILNCIDCKEMSEDSKPINAHRIVRSQYSEQLLSRGNLYRICSSIKAKSVAILKN